MKPAEQKICPDNINPKKGLEEENGSGASSCEKLLTCFKMFLFFFIASRNTTQGEAGDQQMNSHTDPVHTTSVHLYYSSKVVRKCVNEAFSQLALSEVLARLQVINLLFTY